MSAQPIGVFDSGTGGLSVLRALRDALPSEDFLYFDDSGFGPYGERDEAFVVQRTRAITQVLRGHGIKALVIACNTATAAAVEAVRALHADLPVVGVEPALKPAAASSRTGRIGVIATRGTLASARFKALQAAVGGNAQIVLQPCDGLAAAIDASAQGGGDAPVQALCARYVAKMGAFGSEPGEIDTLVLGCTHYVLVQPVIQALVGPAVQLVATGEAVARQTVRRLGPDGLARRTGPGRLGLLTSGEPQRLDAAVRHWLPHLQALPARGTIA
ncbi:glutamate racemase [Pseudorhodoferax sp. Leaf267]|uniref:glutamate racemase n=1 Tax=Pseudorhodoferax sp. Leaf267 TaxID=1736316 RepID=UPI0006F6C775|nr:glutamate racemase [Pseudorhodoferax sp. Leaf267]KQP18296.1 glutamate racemase [Pseudorhodoferax sp. Leaf267]